MPPWTKVCLVVYDTPASVSWLHRFDSWSGLGRSGAPGGGGGGSWGSGAPRATGCTCSADVVPAATDVTAAAGGPIAATAATPVASDFTVMAVPSSWTSTSV